MSLTDAIVKKVPGFDGNQVYEAIRKDAFDTPPSDGTEKGRVCLPSYLKTSHRSRIENVLLYQSDYVISQEDAAIRLQLFDPSYGRMRSKSIDTLEWIENFDLFAWGGDYTEAVSWLFRFYVSFDPKGLANRYKQSDNLDICDVLQTMNGVFPIGIMRQRSTSKSRWLRIAEVNIGSERPVYQSSFDGCKDNGCIV